MQDILFFISNHLVLSIIWLFSLFLIIFFSTRNLYSKSKIINNFDAIKLINKKKAIIIDTRSFELYSSGHIVNAINIPIKDISLTNINKLKLSKSLPIILIVDSLTHHNKCIKEFIRSGLDKIYLLKDGMDSWEKERLPIIVNKKK
ncbi:rhodanese-like domain-containing protein [Buchnera aphidicola]|uniref:rhodanese-like domain-containing protein n=1 Tax=Buchnera aphidicola TaxID=9 RepID=UPI003463DEC8